MFDKIFEMASNLKKARSEIKILKAENQRLKVGSNGENHIHAFNLGHELIKFNKNYKMKFAIFVDNKLTHYCYDATIVNVNDGNNPHVAIQLNSKPIQD